MGLVEHSVRYAAPPERVWAVLVDFERSPQHLRDVLRVELEPPGPVRLGSVVRETRRMFGKEHTEPMTVVEFEPPERLVFDAGSKRVRYRTEHRLTADGAGTRLTVRFEARGVGWFGALLSALFAPLASRAVKKCLARDLEDLRSAVEAGSGHGAGVEGAPDAPDEVT